MSWFKRSQKSTPAAAAPSPAGDTDYRRLFQTASETSRQIAQLDDPLAIFRLVGATIHQWIGAGYVAVSVLDEQVQAMRAIAWYGFGRLYDDVTRLFGVDAGKFAYYLKDMTAEELRQFRSGHLERFEGGLYNMASRRLPKPVCDAAEKILGFSGIYTLGFVWQQRHFGGITILAKTDITPLSEMIETLVGQAVIAIKRLKSEQALRESEERLRRFSDVASEGIYFHDQGTIIDANPAFASIMGFAGVEDVIGRQLIDMVAPASRPLAGEKMMLRTLEAFESVLLRQDGTTFPAEISARDYELAGRHLRVGSVRDITARKQAAEALRVTTERLQALIRGAPLAIYTLDADNLVQSWNPAAERVFGWTEQEVLGRPLPFVPDERKSESGVIRRRLVAGETITGLDLHRRRKDGSPIDINAWLAPLYDAAGDFGGNIAIAADVSEHRRLQEQLLQAQKMEAIGQLAGGVAHDFNNLLTAITGYADFAREQLPADSPVANDIGQVLKAAQRAADLTRQLLAFSRRQMMELRVIDLNDLVFDMSKMLRRLLGEDIELSVVAGQNLGRVKADPGQIEQVLLNLAVNARDAMPAGGRLLIETTNASLDEAYARSHPDTSAGEYVLLGVSDTGSGMTEEVQQHLFEPFYTTKELGKGTGLGLATVFGIVKQHGGSIYCYSDLGRGTVFKIYLPRVATEAAQPATGADEESLPMGSETVLVAEDEAIVRDIAVRSLTALGYRVLEAGNGYEGVRIAQEHRGPIDLLITDVVMPQMGGPALAQQIRQARPDIKVLFVSGYTTDLVATHEPAEQGTQFLQKPFTAAALARRVRQLLDAGPCKRPPQTQPASGNPT